MIMYILRLFLANSDYSKNKEIDIDEFEVSLVLSFAFFKRQVFFGMN